MLRVPKWFRSSPHGSTILFPRQCSYQRMMSTSKPFGKVLIANRGEIACRVIRTCQKLDIPTVALYSVADGPHALHAQMANESYQIGHGPSASESYLLQDEILKIAQVSGAQAIHPGYGFLSENANFATKIQNIDNLTFIGPPPAAIHAMGSKSMSKAIMEAANVPTTPGYYGDDTQDPNFLLDKAKNDIGFPLLIKAIMGGGGKGMRLVWNEREFKEKLESCQREALNSFGDSRVLLEKYLVRPRHVEVQVVADTHGQAVHLFERDCSLQRRHQKIIEEAPAADLPDELRSQLGTMGTRAALAAGYVNAGTVEFLLDTQSDNGDFYFCEMNTRLQVEHPITEQITGIDLVEWQLRIAAGEKLPMSNQDDIICNGHAFEARIYAENAAKNFMPSTGTVWYHNPPAIPNTGADPVTGIRVDTGIGVGHEVGVFYDPMICKLVVHDKDRSTALNKLVKSLKNYQIAGVTTNIDFLVNCAEHPTFQQAGAINTGFLEDYMDDVKVNEAGVPSPLASSVGAFVTMLHLEGRVGVVDIKKERKNNSPWSSLSGSWMLGGQVRRILKQSNGTEIECISNRDGSFDFILNGDKFHIDGTLDSKGILSIAVNNIQKITVATAVQQQDDGSIFELRMWPNNFSQQKQQQQGNNDYFWEVEIENPYLPKSQSITDSSSALGTVKAPMPGKITRIHCAVGDIVQEGDLLITMEAMKMEHAVKAPRSGIVKELSFKTNNVVVDGAILAVVGEADEDTEDLKTTAN